jgi:hypothetical protein
MTTEIFHDYGFVEPYPQRWALANGMIQFDLVEHKKGEVQLVWLPKQNPHESIEVELLKHHQKAFRQLYKILENLLE